MRVEKDLHPISLTPVISKSLEWYLREWIMEIVEELMDPYQFSSLKGSSTTFALIKLVHNWVGWLESHAKVLRILVLDFHKAFDRVDNAILMSKISNTGVPDFLTCSVTSFLCDHRQRVKIGSTTSTWSHLKVGVPQGPLLGPVAFLLHINNLQTVCPTVKYVDDSSIWDVCNRSGSNSQIQTARNQATTWTKTNKVQLNTDKTKEMRVYFGRKELDTLWV